MSGRACWKPSMITAARLGPARPGPGGAPTPRMRRRTGFRPVRRRRPYDAAVGERNPGASIGASPVDAAVAPVASLVERAAAGDQDAWDALVERFSPLVWSVTRSLRLGGAD